MNAKSLRMTALLALLALSVNAADSGETDPAVRVQMEDKLHSANDRLNEAAREVGNLSMQLYGDPFTHSGGSRAILGINVGGAILARLSGLAGQLATRAGTETASAFSLLRAGVIDILTRSEAVQVRELLPCDIGGRVDARSGLGNRDAEDAVDLLFL